MLFSEVDRYWRKCIFQALCDHGHLNKMFIENQYNWERPEYD